MVTRRKIKRKNVVSSQNLKKKISCKREIINYSEKRLHEHPYETRSKSQIKTTTNLVSRRQSFGSVIYLGTFRKSPQLVTLEDSNESSPDTVDNRMPDAKSENITREYNLEVNTSS